MTRLKAGIKYQINRFIVWPIQSLFRGYSERDLWELDHHLAKLIIKRLKAFKSMPRNGYPSDLPNCKGVSTGEKDSEYAAQWERYIDKMIEAFDIAIKNYGLDCTGSLSKTETTKIMGIEVPKINMHMVRHHEERYREGIELFAKYFRNLWD